MGSLREQQSTLAEYYTVWSLVKERVSKVVLICHAVRREFFLAFWLSFLTVPVFSQTYESGLGEEAIPYLLRCNLT